tara:strand:- start:21675 stop:21881 length:207 start_codon:yes stop_codon:yes gene_type:complete
MAKNKKPTMMEVKNAIGNLIKEFSNIANYVSSLDQTLGSYIEFKKDGKKFPKWLEKEVEKIKKKESTK